MPTTRDLRQELDERMQRFSARGVSRAAMLAQLNLAGYPIELLRQRFPEMPGVAFGDAPPTTPARDLPTQGRGIAPRANTHAQHLPTDNPSAARSPEAIGASRHEATATLRSPCSAADQPAPPYAGVHAARRDIESRRQDRPRSPNFTPVSASAAATELKNASREVEQGGGISFHYVPLIQCSFPHADPGESITFTRRNGWLELTLGTTRPETGLPYGVPARLLTIYAASEAVRTKSPEIFLGTSVHDFLRRLDVPITRGDRGSLRVYANQLLKLIHCTLTIDENIRDPNGRTGLHIRQALFAEEARLWWDDETRGVGQGSSLVLSSVLFHSILDRSAPLSTNAIKQLRKSPMDLDVYAWLAHRLYHLSKPSTVTWQQLSEQFGHGYAELRFFRRPFAASIKRVLEVYPEAKLKLTDAGVILLPSRPHTARALNKA
jgi:hypothetical protein